MNAQKPGGSYRDSDLELTYTLTPTANSSSRHDRRTDWDPGRTIRARLTTKAQPKGGGADGHGMEKARDKCWLSAQGQRRAGPGERKEIKKKSRQLLYLMRVMAN